jgi:catechol 2,3-dioxygenase-like lactoylglutathione lyase family enzyme
MLGGSALVSFVASADLDRSHAFYGDLLGLELVGSSSFANAYDSAGTTLRVTLVEEPVCAPYTILGWSVDDISRHVSALRRGGVEFKRYPRLDQDASGVWTAPGGSRIAWFEDPDGNTLSIQQAP